MNIHRTAAALCLLALAACGEKTPDEAKQKLAELKVPPTAESLLAKTKQKQSEDVARTLVEAGVDPNARQENGMTVLMSAVFNDQEETAKALLARGADVRASAGGYNALGLAVERNNPAMVRLLLAAGADPAERPERGMSALERAQNAKNAPMVELLKGAQK